MMVAGGECVAAYFGNSQTVGDGVFGAPLRPHALCMLAQHLPSLPGRTSLRFNANDFDGWFEMFDGGGDSCDHSSSTNGHNNVINVGNIFQNLDSERSLTGDNVRVIEAVDIEQVALFR